MSVSPSSVTPAALENVRVIDFGQYIAGPMAAMFLADHGADVIRIDPPGGPRYDSDANATWNRGKRSIVLDLKASADLEVARRLVGTADVVIENFRPGVMDRLGLGARAMLALNPGLVYCSLPGFSSTDPRVGMRAWEGVLGAATGSYSTHPLLHIPHPIYNCLPFSSSLGAYMGAVAVALSLYAKSRGGPGQIIEIPLFGATFTAFSGKAMRIMSRPETESLPKWRHVRCSDGRWLMYLPNSLHRPLLRDFGPPGALEGRQLSLEEHLDRIFLTRTAVEWEEYCESQGAEGTVCNTSADWLAHPLALGSEIVQTFTDPLLGEFQGPGLPLRLSETPGRVNSPRPRLDAHRQEILAELPPPSRPAPGDAGGARQSMGSMLRGLKVLDLGIILAAPSCGRTLAEFGADVIKIDSPHRNPVNWHNDINRGKRSILLDLKAKQGLEVFWRLLEDAEVVLENFRTGVADKLGIGYEAVRARRPDIIYCSFNAFGEFGPYKTRPGREVVAQAMTGMQARYGGTKPMQNPFNANDYATGLAGCFGIALALLHRQRTGKGQYVRSALTYSATMLQSSLMQGHAAKRWDEPSGQEALGRGPLYRAYQAADGWLFMVATREELQQCPALADLARQTGKALECALEQRFRGRNVDAWLKDLRAAGISAERVFMSFNELMDDPLVQAEGLSIIREHDELGMVMTTGPAMRLPFVPLTPGRPAPKPGSDARDILAEIGMLDRMDELVKAGVIVLDGIQPGGAS